MALLGALLTLAVSVASSLAQGGSGGDGSRGERSHPTFDDRGSEENLARERRRSEEREARRKSGAERERRRASRGAHRGLRRAEAVALAKREFAQAVEAPPWRALRRLDGAEVHRYRGDFSALVREPGGKKLLVESMLPLRSTVETGDKAPVDLGLEAVEGRYRPKNPLVRVEIADTVEEGIEFPALGYRVRLERAGAGGGAAPAEQSTVVEDKVFDPEAAGLTDTDALVTPVPTGAEVGFQLRSADSPEQLTLVFDLPRGLSLRMGPTARAPPRS